MTKKVSSRRRKTSMPKKVKNTTRKNAPSPRMPKFSFTTKKGAI